jgi:ABC-type phosphate transport system substrate-binding protein
MKRLTSFGMVLGLAALLLAGLPWSTVRSSGPPPTDQNIPTEPLAIIVNRSNPVDGLSMLELRRVFLGERKHWANDRRITLVMREPGEPERKVILRDVYQMNEDQLKNHFIHGLFTGEILVSPKILATPTGVRKFVFNVPGAIGYVRASDLDDTVKVLRIDELLPEDGAYKLRVEVRVAK